MKNNYVRNAVTSFYDESYWSLNKNPYADPKDRNPYADPKNVNSNTDSENKNPCIRGFIALPNHVDGNSWIRTKPSVAYVSNDFALSLLKKKISPLCFDGDILGNVGWMFNPYVPSMCHTELYRFEY